MIKVFIGYDNREKAAFSVLSHSILKYATLPVSIVPLRLENLKTAHEMGWITFWIHPNYLLGNKYHYINMSFPNIIDCLKYLERKS